MIIKTDKQRVTNIPGALEETLPAPDLWESTELGDPRTPTLPLTVGIQPDTGTSLQEKKE